MHGATPDSLLLRGYRTLPGLIKLEDGPVFQVDEQLPAYLAEKQAITHQPYQECALREDVLAAVCQYVHDRLIVEHPTFKPTLDLSELAGQIQEDLVIHQFTKDRDWMAGCHASLPGHWAPEERIGKSFREIHETVPGMTQLDKLGRSMLAGSFYRFVWGVSFDGCMNCHPARGLDYIFHGECWQRVERQVIIALPEVQAVLFVVRPYLFEPNLPLLRDAILAMTPEQRAYKEWPQNFLDWLAEQ